MASNVILRLKTFPYFGTMPAKNISFLSEYVKALSNKHKRLICTKPESITISDKLKAKKLQLCYITERRKASQFNRHVGLGTNHLLHSMSSSTRSISSSPNKGI